MVKQNWGTSICVFFNRGFCKNGTSCSFSHDKTTGDDTKIPTCKNWINGTCKFGTNCMFSHETRNIDDALAIHNAKLLNEAAQTTYLTTNPLYDYSELPGLSNFSPGQNLAYPQYSVLNSQQTSYPPHQEAYNPCGYPGYQQVVYHPQQHLSTYPVNNQPVPVDQGTGSEKAELVNNPPVTVDQGTGSEKAELVNEQVKRGIKNSVDLCDERPLKRQRREI